MQAFFLVADDIMDGSTTRRGQPCWYKRDDVGMTAVNDAILLETCIYTLLHNHFHDQPNYLDTLEAFIYVSRTNLKSWILFNPLLQSDPITRKGST